MKVMKRMLGTLLIVMAVWAVATVAWGDGNVAKIGNNEYATFNDAWSVALESTSAIEIKLLQNVELSDTLSTLTGDKDVTINLQGHSITTTKKLVMIYGTLTVKDSSTGANGQIIYNGNETEANRFIHVAYSSKLSTSNKSGKFYLVSGEIKDISESGYPGALIAITSGSATVIDIGGGKVTAKSGNNAITSASNGANKLSIHLLIRE